MSDQPKAEAAAAQPAADAGSAQKKEKAAKPKKVAAALEVQPEYIQARIKLFDELYAKQQADIAAKTPAPIKIKLPDGKVLDGQSWRTTPMEICKGISEGLARDVVISKVNGEVWDLTRPLEGDCDLVFLKFDNDEAKAVFWHSSAHVLGEAMELHTGGCLCYGPPIQDGFYYDMFLKDRTISEESFPHLEELMKTAVKEKQQFQRLEMTKEDLKKMFAYNEFKLRIIDEKITTPTTTVYRCGPLIDLCRGPHIPDTGRIKALSVLKASSTYWEGKADAESLQRIYGISFPNKELLEQWKEVQRQAAERDHRKVGREQELFFFNELSPGSCFFLPRGAHIYNKLVSFIKTEYWKRGFTEVVSPNMFNSKLWETSGHWKFYKDDMFTFEVEKETFALKPMNCPGHCLMFGHRTRSYKELPIRFADFGVLHRNELSGALTGLTRVRRFQQDDAHIFCLASQIETEIESCLQFLRYVYGIFQFTFDLNLSTRPENYLGDIKTWDFAEKALENALNKFGDPWKIKPGDGAFYGPKIDIQIKDALNRAHQCATIQLDFQLPERFQLEYTPQERVEGVTPRPVIVHRAVLGSVERMIAVLTENYGGKWPFWLSPRQALVVAVHPKFEDYAVSVAKELHDQGFVAEVGSDEGLTLNKKIRNGQLAQYNFILVVGEKEQQNHSANVRLRDNSIAGERSIAELVAHFQKLTTEFRQNDHFEGQVVGGAAPADDAAAAAEGAQ